MSHDIRVRVPWELAAPLAVLNFIAAVMEMAALNPLVPWPPLLSLTGSTGEVRPLRTRSILREEAERAAA